MADVKEVEIKQLLDYIESWIKTIIRDENSTAIEDAINKINQREQLENFLRNL